MSHIYDNWEKLVTAVIRREELRELAYCESLDTINSITDSDINRHSHRHGSSSKHTNFSSLTSTSSIYDHQRIPEPVDYSDLMSYHIHGLEVNASTRSKGNLVDFSNSGTTLGAVLHEQFKKLAMSDSMCTSQQNEAHCDGAISIGPWGGQGGDEWSFKPKAYGITKIVISYGMAIASLKFHCSSETSRVFGGSLKYGTKTNEINIAYPSEYLTGITGTYEFFSKEPSSPMVITSLSFYTNKRKYGIFGEETGNHFTFPMEGGEIIGFHGQAGILIDAIGVYVKPNLCSMCKPKLVVYEESEEPIDVTRDVVPRQPGPWGGSSGKQWDDGVFSYVRKIVVHFRKSINVIHTIQFGYLRTDGKSVLMPKHGGNGGDTTETIKLDNDDEFLIGVAGFYGPVENNDGMDVIRSLTFHTNKRMYGPFGTENGTYFTSISSRGKVVGFHGSNGTYLNSIGVHTEYV